MSIAVVSFEICFYRFCRDFVQILFHRKSLAMCYIASHIYSSISGKKNLLLFSSFFFRMKEQLIKELVKSEKDAELMNKQYADKIKGLEKV